MSKGSLKVLQVVSSSAQGGAERHLLDLSEGLLARGHEVEVVCPAEGWVSAVAREAGIPVSISPMRRAGWLATAGLLSRRVSAHGFDVIHTHLTRASYIGLAAGLRTRAPVITTVHLLNNDRLYRQLAHGRNRLVAVSEYVQSKLADGGIAEKYVDTVYNGTDFLQFEPADSEAVRAELGIPRGRKVIGIVGRICRSKGHLEMVRALRRIRRKNPEVHAVFVGRVEESFRRELREAVETEGVRESITFTGVRADVPRVLDAFDIAAMPSHMETFGIAAIEAMARGRPVIASNVGALPEVVQHGHTGLLVPVGAHQLAEAADYLLANDSVCREMGAQARQVVAERFSADRMAGGFENVYRAAVGAN